MLLISWCSPFSLTKGLQSQLLGSYWLHLRSKTSPSYLLYVMKYRPIFKLSFCEESDVLILSERYYFRALVVGYIIRITFLE